MKFDLIGPPTVRKDGRIVVVGGPLHQLALAILVSEQRHISTEALIDLMWADEPDNAVPKAQRARLHEIISDLRRALRNAGCDELLPPHRNGYRAEVHVEQVDLLRFHDRRRTARSALEVNDHHKAIGLFRDAFAEWGTRTGPPTAEPFAGLSGRWVRIQREHLRRAYLSDLAACVELELGLGVHDQLVLELVALVAACPLDERLVGLLMLAYHRAGQSAEALRTFVGVRQRLADELGTEPGEPLRLLHQQILRQDPALQAAHPAASILDGRPHPQPTEVQTVNEYYSNSVDGIVTGSLVQASKIDGDVHIGASARVEPPLAGLARAFRQAVRAARQSGVLAVPTATAVEAELARALACLAEHGAVDDFAAAMASIRHLVDGADDLVCLADKMVDVARWGHDDAM